MLIPCLFPFKSWTETASNCKVNFGMGQKWTFTLRNRSPYFWLRHDLSSRLFHLLCLLNVALTSKYNPMTITPVPSGRLYQHSRIFHPKDECLLYDWEKGTKTFSVYCHLPWQGTRHLPTMEAVNIYQVDVIWQSCSCTISIKDLYSIFLTAEEQANIAWKFLQNPISRMKWCQKLPQGTSY